MNKTELVGAVAHKADLPKNEAERAVNAIIETITQALSEGDNVALVGFGNFDVQNRPKRNGRNPRTGEAIEIPAAKLPKFKAGKALKDAVAESA